MYISVLGPKCAKEIPALGFVELCLGVVVSGTSSYFTHTHTSYFLSTSLTTFLFTPLIVHT
jgi:hypothetical protein